MEVLALDGTLVGELAAQKQYSFVYGVLHVAQFAAVKSWLLSLVG